MNNNKQQLACLYTKHKTQKRKVWQDGRLVLNANSSKAILHDADPPPGSGDPSLGECEIPTGQLQAILEQFSSNIANTSGTRLETERYLIEIEGPWKSNNNNNSVASTIPKRPHIGKKSSSMQKLLNSKFQRPKSYVPPPPGTQRSRTEQLLGKRRRPLQPGELVARHYGGNGHAVGGTRGGISRGGFEDSQSKWNNQHHQQPNRNNYLQHSHGDDMVSSNPQAPPRFRPELQRNEQNQQHQVMTQPPNNVQSSFRTYGDLAKTVEPASGAQVGHGNQCRSGQQQKQQHGRPVPRRRNNQLSFAQNEFDSANYYGNNGEEEENDQQKESRASSMGNRSEQHKKDNRSDINPYNNRENNAEIEHSNESEFDANNSNHREEKTQIQKQTNPYARHNESYSSSVSPIPHNSRNTNENDSKISNTISNDRKASNAAIEQSSKSDNTSSRIPDRNQNRKTGFNDEEESEEDDEDFSDDDMGAPVSFRLKPMADTNQNGKDVNSSSISGNRLLALFGAGTNDKSLSDDENADKNGKRFDDDNSGNKESMSIEIGGRNDDHKKNKPENQQSGGMEKKQGNMSGSNGFYLPPADTSSDESSDEE